MTKVVKVQTPVRLHFGMFGIGQQQGRQFGGVGMMVSPPSVEIELSDADRLQVDGPLAMRAEACLHNAARCLVLPETPVALRIRTVPDEHTGLGIGTQLHLAITAGLLEFVGRAPLSAGQLAQAAGRGLRSAVGTHGFLHGGLIVDGGKEADGELGVLAKRCEVPEDWRVVLVRPAGVKGLAGAGELSAFRDLPGTPSGESDRLISIVDDRLLPALRRGDCGDFGEALHDFGLAAGGLFAPVQGGPFASAEIAKLVESIRVWGVPGVGQSSWGPTVFAVTADPSQAEALKSWLLSKSISKEEHITISQPSNRGSTISTLS